jgi:hypothetical protein
MPEIFNLSLPITDRTDPRLVSNTRSGGAAINGQEQIISPLSAVWKWTINLPLNNDTRVRGWRMLRHQLQGRWNYVRIRVCDCYRLNRAEVGATGLAPVLYADGVPHSDGAGFKLAQPSAEILALAPKGAKSIEIAATGLNDAMSAGLFFSIADRLYVVTDWERIGETYRLGFEPGLRVAAVPETDVVDFDAKSVWRLESDDEGRTDLRLGRFATAQINLIEPLGWT